MASHRLRAALCSGPESWIPKVEQPTKTVATSTIARVFIYFSFNADAGASVHNKYGNLAIFQWRKTTQSGRSY